jgi:hypothetical protein
MTSLLNPNDIEIKDKLINNINKCIENLDIYSFSKKNLIEGLINNYINNHFKLNIEKDKLLEYIILLIQKKVLDRIINEYNQVNLLNIESINTFNSYILSITNIKYENNEPLLNLINIIYNKWRSQDIDFIYYHIYNLKKSNDKCLNLINVSIDELDNNYNHMISINNSIKELRETNETHMNLIKELRETNENHMNSIKELELKNTNNLIILMLIILFKIIIIIYYNDINIK